MTPWPTELLSRYPLAPTQVPERPWWTRHGGGWTRRDGKELWIPTSVQRLILERPTETHRDLLGQAAEVDAKDPLPPPPVRAGQVWAFSLADGWMTITILATGPLGGTAVIDLDGRLESLRVSGGQGDPVVWVEGVRVYRRPALLVLDPSYPADAPWTPRSTMG